jgi:hypothetical protein
LNDKENEDKYRKSLDIISQKEDNKYEKEKNDNVEKIKNSEDDIDEGLFDDL